MEGFLFSPEEPTLFSIIGIGGVADEIVNTLRLQNLRAATFINLSDANEAVTGYLETVNELLPEESNYPKVVILITDLSEGVETNHILTLIHAIKKKEQLLVLFPVTHCPCEVQNQADMLLITDKEKLYQYLKPCSVVDLQREFQRLLCQQVIDLVETSTVPGLIHLDFRELKYFIASLPQHAVYY